MTFEEISSLSWVFFSPDNAYCALYYESGVSISITFFAQCHFIKLFENPL